MLLSGCKSGAHCHPTRISQEDYGVAAIASESVWSLFQLDWDKSRRQEAQFRGKGFVVSDSDDGSNSFSSVGDAISRVAVTRIRILSGAWRGCCLVLS